MNENICEKCGHQEWTLTESEPYVCNDTNCCGIGAGPGHIDSYYTCEKCGYRRYEGDGKQPYSPFF